jgi:hypothetical protein
MCKLVRRSVGAAAFGLILATSIAFAQQAQTVRVRGTVEADGPVITVKARDGKTYMIKLTDNAAVRGIIKAAGPGRGSPNFFLGARLDPNRANSRLYAVRS